MRRSNIMLMVSFVMTFTTFSVRADVEWAYQVLDESLLPQRDLEIDLQAPRSVPGSSLQRSQEQIDDHWNPPDWFPDDHYAPVPEVVAYVNVPSLGDRTVCIPL